MTDEIQRIAARYAQALFSLSKEQSALDAVEADLSALERAIAESPELRAVIHAPIIDKNAKDAALAALAKKMRLNPLTARFLSTLAQNQRLDVLTAAAAAYRALLDMTRGILRGEVVSAAPLTNMQVKEIATALTKRYGQGVQLDTSVDPDLIGGVVIHLKDIRLDYSIAGKLSRLRAQLMTKAANAA